MLFLQEAHASTLPLQATEVAGQWDNLYLFLVWLSVFFFVLVVGGMLYFAIRYRKSVSPRAKYITHNHLIEVIWTVIPTVLLLAIFGWGWVVYSHMTQAPADAIEIRVIGKQWQWTFQYQDGRVLPGKLYVPVNKPVKLVMTSEDVLHSFFVPNFRVKQDVVPGMYTSVWFQPTITGKHQVFCTEYCGSAHSLMLAKVIVLDDKQWLSFSRGKEIEDDQIPAAGIGGMELASAEGSSAAQPVKLTGLAAQGKSLLEAKGCIACHSTDGSQKVGPSLKGVFGSEVELASGDKVNVDENYIRESIENPGAKLVKGFGPVMPTFKGLVSETELNALVSYIKTIQ